MTFPESPAFDDGDGPLVSVIVPTYGDADQLPGALQSIAAQTYRPLEVVLIDSSGVDALERWADATDNVVYRQTPPDGPAAARNAGIAAMTGAIVTFCDADDRWQPAKVATQVRTFRDQPEVDLVYSDQYVTEA